MVIDKMKIPKISDVYVIDQIFKAYKNKENLIEFEKSFKLNYKLPKDYMDELIYLKSLDSLISIAFSAACIGNYKKSNIYYNKYLEKLSKLDTIKNKISSLIDDLSELENKITDFNSIYFELSRLVKSSNSQNIEFKYLSDRVLHYKSHHKSNSDIITRSNILSVIVKDIDELYLKESKKFLDSPKLDIPASDNSPLVNFNLETGILTISGTSITIVINNFWDRIHSWLFRNKEKLSGCKLVIDLDYFNSVSTNNLYKMVNFFNKNGGLITWVYDSDDEDMLETGKEFEEICDTKFKIITKEEYERRVNK